MRTGRIKWFNEKRGFGFIVLADDSQVFFHVKDGRPFYDSGSTLPEFDTSLGTTVKVPDYYDDDGYGMGAVVFFNMALGRGDRPKACPWGYADDFNHVALKIKARVEEAARKEAERLRCNPRFRAWEERVYRDGKRGMLCGIFIGTKTEFLRNYLLGRQYDPLVSTPFREDMMKYERWFERETASGDGWVKCENPRTTKLPLTFEQARVLLSSAAFDSLVDHAFGDTEFGWTKAGQQIAGGYDNRRGCEVWISKTVSYAVTEFRGKEADALYNARGKTNRSERNDAGDPREW